jgi:streptogramin lyase
LGTAALGAPVGKLKQFKVPTAGSSPSTLPRPRNGNFWFTEFFVNNQNALGPSDITVAADGIVWFADQFLVDPVTLQRVKGRLDAADGAITRFKVDCIPRKINIAADGAVWFTERFTRKGRDPNERLRAASAASRNSAAAAALATNTTRNAARIRRLLCRPAQTPRKRIANRPYEAASRWLLRSGEAI